jgi:hypothetical protein
MFKFPSLHLTTLSLLALSLLSLSLLSLSLSSLPFSRPSLILDILRISVIEQTQQTDTDQKKQGAYASD